MTKMTVIGAGPVGLAFAILHANAENPVTLIDQNTADIALQDPRSLALSYGSIQTLQQLGLEFSKLPNSPIKHIHISEQNAWGHTQLHCDEHHVPQLGTVVRYGDLVNQLYLIANKNPHIEFIRPAQVTRLKECGTFVEFNLQAGDIETSRQTDLLIHAEGGVFSADEKHNVKDYQQTAIIANITLAEPRPAWAWERFTASGPCALLPASQDGYTFNLVWCVDSASAEELLKADEAHCCQVLNGVLAHLTGQIVGITPRQHFLLGLKQIPDLQSSCRTSIGNAAQILHPVAGQGFNLGLRDAFALHQHLNKHTHLGSALSEFTKARRRDRSTTVAITNQLATNFSVFPSLKHFRSLGFGILNIQPLVKTWVANQFMYGTRDS